MKLIEPIIKMLSEKAGREITSAPGADFLRNDIESKTGEILSLNTVKRLVGILPYSSEPRGSTLEIIARYLGFDNWLQLQNTLSDRISDFNTPEGFLDLKNFPTDTRLILMWNPGRKIIIRHIGNAQYQVVEAQNSKLKNDDILSLSHIAAGFPFMVKNVIRNGESLGSYTAASVEGLTSIEII